MTQPSGVREARGRRVEVGKTVVPFWRTGLRWLVPAVFVLRAVLSFGDAEAVLTDGLSPLPYVSTPALGISTPLWPLTWGGLALISAIVLVLRIRMGWLLAAMVGVAYLAMGISDTTALLEASPSDGLQTVWAVVVDVVVPVVVLGGLLAIRGWYLPPPRRARASRRHPSLHPRVMPSVPTLERFRHRS